MKGDMPQEGKRPNNHAKRCAPNIRDILAERYKNHRFIPDSGTIGWPSEEEIKAHFKAIKQKENDENLHD